ncbi:thiol-disulfide oxidoreductase DCC family protein [Candidatus Eisenbacteria bacterium]|uniref:Thiol-disulfide oxidoreductase DCC family protein n=1 Tax=Eiseniibacteriota bacterium TaxID=2212470 RepID=A0ABV6YIF0_UNCEI
MPDQRHGWQLLYDAECALCTRFARLVQQFDRPGAIEVVSLQDFHARDTAIPMKELLADVHLVGEDGRILRGEDALQQVVETVPQAGPFRWMARSSFGRESSRFLYRAMKRLRRCVRCP